VGARVLIIEDNPTNLELMSYILVAFGHSVLTATDGFSGIQAAITETPDLVVCDVQLPDILGFEVARQLRSDPELSSTPLVAVTALAMVGDRERILGAGFDGYLAKPIDPQTFLQEIESFLLPHFHHSVPRYSPGAVATPEPAPAERSLTVLAVDNLRINLELARSILAPSGYRVLTAGSVSQGLARARDGRCDLILSDVSLSGESGYDLLIAVRADSQLRTIPFILITSTMMDEKDRKLGLALGADRFLRRPIEPEELLAEVRACLHQKDWC
jgi:two-component system cell cycle response regulator